MAASAYATESELRAAHNLGDLVEMLPGALRDATETAQNVFFEDPLNNAAYEIDAAFQSAGFTPPVDPAALLTDSSLQSRLTSSLKRWNIVLALQVVLQCDNDDAISLEAARVREILSKLSSGDASAIPGLGSVKKAYTGKILEGLPGQQMQAIGDCLANIG